MLKFIAGVTLGVIITIAAYSLLDTSSREGPIPQDEQSEFTEAAESAVMIEVDRQRTDSETEADTDTAEGNLTDEESVLDPILTTPPVVSGGPAPAMTESAESVLSPPHKRDYSVYPPEIADILDTRNPRQLQTRYEAEEREDSWAAYTEGQLAAYFAQKPELAQFNISRIDCQSSVCEIQAIGYGTGAREVATADIIQQPWHDFKQMSMSTRDPEPGVFAVVLVLARTAE